MLFTTIPMHLPSVFLSLAFSVLACHVAAAQQPANVPAERLTVHQLIENLGHDDYYARQTAKAKLIELTSRQGTDSLIPGLTHESLEVRSAVSEILVMIRQREFGRELERLSNPNIPTDRLESHGWKQFSTMAGNDMEARFAFAAVCRRYPSAFDSIHSINHTDRKSINPFQLRTDDYVGWTTLLLMAIDGHDREGEIMATAATQNARIAMSLSQPSTGLDLLPAADRTNWRLLIFGRLVTRWLDQHESIIDRRTALCVAVRYQCNHVAIQIAESVLRDPGSTASSITTAMLTLAKLSPAQCSFAAFVGDDRTAHAWQMIAQRKIKIRTQVRDIAIALMLDQADADPRQFGYRYLEADPLLRYRDYSLGFETDQDREIAHAQALTFLTTPAN
jgi:hypothetical protein